MASTHRALKCTGCNKLCHIGSKCGNAAVVLYKKLKNSLGWKCPVCLAINQNEGINAPEQCFLRELTNCFKGGKASFKVAHVNVNGLLTSTKLQEIKLILCNTNIDILDITETKLHKKVEDSELEIQSYKFFRRDREVNCGGGCMLYFSEHLDLVEKKQSKEHDNIEAIWADLTLHSQKVCIAVIYRPPDDRGFFTLFEKHIEHLKTKKKNILKMGDLNSDMFDKANANEKKLNEILKSQRLQNIIKELTRITENTKTLIDVLLVSNPDKVERSGVFDVGIADHRMIYSIPKYQRKKVFPVIRMVTDKKMFDTGKFREVIQTVPWHTCKIFDDTDDNLWMVEKLYKDVANEYIPKRKAKIRSKSLPWMDSNRQLVPKMHSSGKNTKR